MDSNPIHHPSPAKKNEMLVFRLRSLLMICLADWWTWTPSATPLQPIKWNASFWIVFTSDDQPGWLMDSNAIHHPSLPKKMKSSFLYYIKLLMISRAGWWTRTPSASPLQPKKWNAHFCITINFWFRPDWSMDSNPIHHPSPTNKMKCSFLDYAQLLMIGRLVDGLKPHPPPPFTQKMKCSFLDYVQLQMIGWAARLTWTPSTTPLQPKTWNACFCITFNIWCWPDWSMDSNPICHPL